MNSKVVEPHKGFFPSSLHLDWPPEALVQVLTDLYSKTSPLFHHVMFHSGWWIFSAPASEPETSKGVKGFDDVSLVSNLRFIGASNCHPKKRRGWQGGVGCGCDKAGIEIWQPRPQRNMEGFFLFLFKGFPWVNNMGFIFSKTWILIPIKFQVSLIVFHGLYGVSILSCCARCQLLRR